MFQDETYNGPSDVLQFLMYVETLKLKGSLTGFSGGFHGTVIFYCMLRLVPLLFPNVSLGWTGQSYWTTLSGHKL